MINTGRFEEVIQINMSREIGGNPVYWVSAYLVDGLLIDTGCSYTADELIEYLDDKRPLTVVNTHFHEDHIGGNHLIKERLSLDIFAHPDSIPFISQGFKLFPYQEILWGYPTQTEVKPVPDVIETRRFRFHVRETPGHCAGHIVLIEPSKGWCFSGDIFARETPKCIRPEEDMGKTIRSMKDLADLKTERLVLFTSIGRIVEDGRQALLNCVHYLEDLSGKVKQRREQGMEIHEIVRELFGGEHAFARLTNGQYTTENLVRSLIVSV